MHNLTIPSLILLHLQSTQSIPVIESIHHLCTYHDRPTPHRLLHTTLRISCPPIRIHRPHSRPHKPLLPDRAHHNRRCCAPSLTPPPPFAVSCIAVLPPLLLPTPSGPFFPAFPLTPSAAPSTPSAHSSSGASTATPNTHSSAPSSPQPEASSQQAG